MTSIPSHRRRRGSTGSTLRFIVIIAVSASSVLAHRPAISQAPSASATPGHQPIGLPRVRDYEPIPTLPDIHFDVGQASIRRGDAAVLDASAEWLRAHTDHLVLIEGHSDTRGPATAKNEFNMDLAERRAQAVKDHLTARGVHPSRITILSYGEERPQCSETREQCWSRNRRSRILVKPR